MTKDEIDDKARIIIWFFRDMCNDVVMQAFKDGLTSKNFSEETWVDIFDEVVGDCRRLSYDARVELSKLYAE